MVSNSLDYSTVSAMSTGKPVATYRKTIRAKVAVEVFNSFTGRPEGLILSGEPGSEDSMVDVWSEVENVYFKRANKKHFAIGNIIPYVREEAVEVRTIEQFTDDELRDIVNQKHFVFIKTIGNLKSEAVAQRLLDIAKAEEKSEKIINIILSKLSELQGSSVI